jgi:hypothetical protein
VIAPGDERLILESRRLPVIWRLALLPLIGLLSILIIRGGPALAWLGWLWLAILTWGIVLLLIRAVSPDRLVLSIEGFRVSGHRPRPLVRWDEVDRFWTLRTPLHAYVLYALSSQPRREQFGLWVFRGLPSEADGYLPPQLKLPPDVVVQTMTEWKAHHGT